jgi:prepilin-type processing-associated H-X9-DG protein
VKLSDPNVINPVLSDNVCTDPGYSQMVDLSVDGSSMATSALYSWTPHRWDGKLKGLNEAWADGHVERVPGNAVIARFKPQAYWNWR